MMEKVSVEIVKINQILRDIGIEQRKRHEIITSIIKEVMKGE